MNPIDIDCPQCGRPRGQKCRNYKGQNCAPHSDRIAEAEAQEVRRTAPQDDPAEVIEQDTFSWE